MTSLNRRPTFVEMFRVFVIIAIVAARIDSTSAAVGDRSDDGVWLEVDPSVLAGVTLPLPTEFRVYHADLALLHTLLMQAPMEDLRSTAVPATFTFFMPMPDGTYSPVSVVQSPVLASTLAALYPNIKTYSVRGVDDPALIGRLTETPTAFQALLRPTSDPIRVLPINTSSDTFFLSFLTRHRTDGGEDFIHAPDEQSEPTPPGPRIAQLAQAKLMTPDVRSALHAMGLASGSTLRTYRLAVATTGEYYQARNLGNGDTDVVASIVAEINNANAVFEPEVAVRMTLTNTVLFSDPNTDPYMAGATACQLRDANPAAINGVINVGDYDIGFVFGSGGGNGCAWYVVCLADKARGAGLINVANAPGNATGLLVHEMGHQLGAHHTFSGQQSGCTAVEYNPGHGYEPGSGTTIMSYRNNCGSDNVQTTPAVPAGRYYHTHSFDEIIANTTAGSGSTCGATAATSNNPPSVNAGGDYTIPRGTPFTLTGSATDPDGDPLTYTWEQFDPAASQRPIDTDLGEGPIFRSVPPTNSPSRTFPVLSDILNNTQTKGEILPSTDRTLTFRLTARDNRSGGGGVAYDDAVLTVSGPPFSITSPNGGETFGAACTIPVTWDVGGGSVAAQVDLEFSSNGGQSFSTLLAGTQNDGSASVAAPCQDTTQARIKASAVGNVFFDISDNNFAVVRNPPTVSVTAHGGDVDDACQFLVTFTATVTDDCGTNAADVTVDATKLQNNFSIDSVTFNPMQVDPTHVSVTGSVLVSNVSSSPAVLNIKVSGKDACGDIGSQTSQAQVFDKTPPTIDVSVSPVLLWPANHKMWDIMANVVVEDNCPGAGYVLTSITSSEPDDGVGDGHTSDDIQDASFGMPDTAFTLRAERSGSGPGRAYTVTYTATDASSNDTSAQAIVTVPHDKK
jgi:hypothetical protein